MCVIKIQAIPPSAVQSRVKSGSRTSNNTLETGFAGAKHSLLPPDSESVHTSACSSIRLISLQASGFLKTLREKRKYNIFYVSCMDFRSSELLSFEYALGLRYPSTGCPTRNGKKLNVSNASGNIPQGGTVSQALCQALSLKQKFKEAAPQFVPGGVLRQESWPPLPLLSLRTWSHPTGFLVNENFRFLLSPYHFSADIKFI